MKELVVISGKGGTGKTTVVGALAALAERAVFADCDVDAANLYLLLQPKIGKTHRFHGQPQAVIDEATCISCGKCEELCRFDAIANNQVEPGACEGCGVCVRTCPVEAISLEQQMRGEWYESETPYGPLVHASLNPGEENSGLLVAEVKKRARSLGEEVGAQLALVDGPGGIGCPAISTLAGADLALLVTEPTLFWVARFTASARID